MNEILTGGFAHYTMVVCKLDGDFDSKLDSDFDSVFDIKLDSDFDSKLDSDFDSKLDGDFDGDFDAGLPVACCWSIGGKETVKKGEIWE